MPYVSVLGLDGFVSSAFWNTFTINDLCSFKAVFSVCYCSHRVKVQGHMSPLTNYLSSLYPLCLRLLIWKMRMNDYSSAYFMSVAQNSYLLTANYSFKLNI